MANLAERIIDKVLSARFLMANFTTIAACLLVGFVFYLCYLKDKLDVGVAVAMGFLAIWKEIVLEYFSRNDRPGETKTITTTQNEKPA